MTHPKNEHELLDEQEALARAGIERAVRGLGIDVMDALSLPPAWREHEIFEAGTASIAQAIGHEATTKLIASALALKAAKGTDLRGILRRACVESLFAITPTSRTDAELR
jgi:hypothetical protein